MENCVASAKPLHLMNPKHPYLRGIEDAVKVVSLIPPTTGGSRVTKAIGGQSLDRLKQVLPFTYGGDVGRGLYS